MFSIRYDARSVGFQKYEDHCDLVRHLLTKRVYDVPIHHFNSKLLACRKSWSAVTSYREHVDKTMFEIVSEHEHAKEVRTYGSCLCHSPRLVETTVNVLIGGRNSSSSPEKVWNEEEDH